MRKAAESIPTRGMQAQTQNRKKAYKTTVPLVPVLRVDVDPVDLEQPPDDVDMAELPQAQITPAADMNEQAV